MGILLWVSTNQFDDINTIYGDCFIYRPNIYRQWNCRILAWPWSLDPTKCLFSHCVIWENYCLHFNGNYYSLKWLELKSTPDLELKFQSIKRVAWLLRVICITAICNHDDFESVCVTIMLQWPVIRFNDLMLFIIRAQWNVC